MTPTDIEPDWLLEIRRAAREKLLQTPIPSRTEEEWRRTDPALWDCSSSFPKTLPIPKTFQNGAASAPTELHSILNELDRENPGALLIQWDQKAVYLRLDSELKRRGVEFGSLQGESGQTPFLRPILQAQLEESTRHPVFTFCALAHCAFWSGGTYLRVPKGVQLPKPIRILYLLSDATPALFPKTLLLLEPESYACVIEEYRSLGPCASQARVLAQTQILLQEAARLDFSNIQRWQGKVLHFWQQTARLEKEARLEATHLALGSATSKALMQSTLSQPGAQSNLKALTFGTDARHLDYSTEQNHLAPQTSSDLVFKSVLKERARSIYRGLIRIEPQARGSSAYQADHNLLLSPQARADSTPILEILTEDVQCKHGATAGPVDPEQAFYLQSRGLPPEEAERLLVMGFFESVLSSLPNDFLREQLGGMIENDISRRRQGK